MPLCGFNQKMVDGIVMFGDGLLSATLERGRANNMGDTGAIEVEVSEIRQFIDALKNKYGFLERSDKVMGEMIYGIAVFADGLFRAALSETDHSTGDVSSAFNREINKVGDFLRELELEHQRVKKLLSTQETMKTMASWIDQRDISIGNVVEAPRPE